MAYKFNHVHLKASDPKKVADWYVNAFDFKIVSDTVRIYGDRFIACDTPDGTRVNISAARTNEKLGPGNANVHWGIEHIGITVDDCKAEIERLKKLGAELLEGPIDVPNGPRIAFMRCPQEVRLELLQLKY